MKTIITIITTTAILLLVLAALPAPGQGQNIGYVMMIGSGALLFFGLFDVFLGRIFPPKIISIRIG